MFEASEWLVFVAASVGLVAVPGPAVLFIVGSSIESGRRTGLVTAAGIGLGNLTHALAAALGVSAVIASTDWGLDVARYTGAGFLLFLGFNGLFAKRKTESKGVPLGDTGGGRSDFAKGMLVALLNPKVILFLLAFLPQFVDAENGSVRIQLLVLGISFVLIGWLGDSAWAMLSGTIWRRLQLDGLSRWGKFLPPVIYIALGVATVMSF